MIPNKPFTKQINQVVEDYFDILRKDKRKVPHMCFNSFSAIPSPPFFSCMLKMCSEFYTDLQKQNLLKVPTVVFIFFTVFQQSNRKVIVTIYVNAHRIKDL